MTGRVVLVLAVLAVAAVLGVVWSRRNGAFVAVRTPSRRPADREGTPIDGALDGADLPARDRAGADRAGVDSARGDDAMTVAEIGVEHGITATFVQFSSEVCTPCRRTAAVLRDLSEKHPGIVHVELDAAAHLDLVRRHHVLRTPTVLVLGPQGEVRGRMSGAVTPAQARASLDSLGQCPGGARAH